jgi:hypothetical protein
MRRFLSRSFGGRAIANHFAYVALFAWPVVCIVLFVMLPAEKAAIWSMLGGYLLLPSNLNVDVPLMPPLDKMSIAAISTFVLSWMKGTDQKGGRPSYFVYLFCITFVVSPILTSLTNSYELQTAAASIPGFYPLDGVKVAGRQLIALLPFFVGVRFLSNESGRALLLKSLPTALVFYSLPMLLELRISPQLHRLVYGYHPHEFIQQVRAGGYRPVVFLEHGLALALLTSLSVLAAVIATRARRRILHAPAGAVAGYLGLLLLLCKSLAAIIYAAVLTPVILFTRPRTWVKVACVAMLIVCAYPLLRWHGVIPVEHISNAASSISADRSGSFNVRVRNEEQLLAKANEKPLLGWGTWGRNRVYDRNTGRDLSVTDGQWIIQFGMYGWFGYLSLFGLLGASAFGALRSLSDKVTPATISLGGLTLLLAVYVMDLIPNANQMSLTLLLAGSIATSTRVRVPTRRERRAREPARSPVPA